MAHADHIKTITIPSDEALLEQTLSEVESYLQSYLHEPDFIYRVLLSTTEAVTNAIKHGNKYDRSKKVIVRMSGDEDWVEVSVEDQGEGFNRKVVRNPLAEENILRSNGRGIFLMETMANTVFYELSGRRLHMIFKPEPPGERSE